MARRLFAGAFALFAALPMGGAFAQGAAPNGETIFKAANCVACHKWNGAGGGGYGGAAANLRKTALDEDGIVVTVRCGHSGGGMPYFEEGAYDNGSCGKKADLDATSMPAAAEHPLSPVEIKAVAGYVMTHFKGKGDPTFEECTGFFGHETHLCEDLPKTASAAGGAPAPAPSHHLQIDAAPDANAVKKP
ncbi:c-type cytochrome [Beijerinckia sp. L45]|uniref:c-type cytochrome n=1 Tax=Beijerinckia sp. L45 TaxID=1641855 RepID=UPI001FEEC17F|nr:c-type cytochrome [Beijerinckia sp. L45]